MAVPSDILSIIRCSAARDVRTRTAPLPTKKKRKEKVAERVVPAVREGVSETALGHARRSHVANVRPAVAEIKSSRGERGEARDWLRQEIRIRA